MKYTLKIYTETEVEIETDGRRKYADDNALLDHLVSRGLHSAVPGGFNFIGGESYTATVKNVWLTHAVRERS